MRYFFSTLAGFAFIGVAILLVGKSAQREHELIVPVPLPIGREVDLNVEPSRPTGESLEVVRGKLEAADEMWVLLEDRFGREAWIPRNRVALIRVY